MSDYISREDVKKLLWERINLATFMRRGIPNAMKSLSFITEQLEKIPAADVRPVKEGHWVKARGSWCTPGGDPVWECSECGKGIHVYGIEHGTYGSDIADGQWVSCPNCGAMMGGTP
jgi:DNA-directed RNA polymerase subunit RPC12/RpoP